MGVTGCLKQLLVRTVEASLIIALILFMPSLPPDTSFTPITTAPAVPLEGKLALNDKLNAAEHWHEGDLKGPEAFASYNGELYTSLYGGEVVKLTGNHITPVVKFGKPCKETWEESICGRPLGLKFDKNGALYVADAYYGIYKVNIATGDKVKLISMDQEIDGKAPKLCNSIALAKNGDIYWTDSSTEFPLEDGIFTMLGDPTGRLIHYNAATKQNKVLIDKIHFANGLILSDDEEFVIVSETAQSRLLRYYLAGPKKGQKDVFIDGLPGLPDNLQSDGKGGFFVPLVLARDAANPSLFQILGPFPLARKLVARLIGLFELAFKTIDQVYPNQYCQRIVHSIGHFETLSFLVTPPRVTILRLSKTGEVIDSIHANANITNISEAFIHKDYLYLGSPFNTYIARIPLASVGWQHLKQATQQAPPPVQATKPPPPPSTQAPPSTPPPTQAPKTPPPTQAPKTPAPTQAPKTAPPTQAPKTPPPTQAPKTAPPTQAPKTAPPTQAPVKKAPAPQAQAAPKQVPPVRAVPLGDGPKKESVRAP